MTTLFRSSHRAGRRLAGGGRRTGGPRVATTERLERRTLLSAYVISNLLDAGPGSLRAAVDAANASAGADSITFAAGGRGNIVLASPLTVTDDLTLSGAGDGPAVLLSGNAATRVLRVTGGATDLALRQLTIANGLASAPSGNAFGGGLLNEGANVTLSQVVMKNNRAVGQNAGGGAIASLGGSVTADRTDFLANSAESADGHVAEGGAIAAEQGARVDVDHASFSMNRARGGAANGGAIAAEGGAQLTLDHSAFTENAAEGDAADGASGGAIETSAAGLLSTAAPTVRIAHCTFSSNESTVRAAGTGGDVAGQGNGGAVSFEAGSIGSVDHSDFDSNRARGGDGGDGQFGGGPFGPGGAGGSSFGGALINFSGNVAVSHSTFSNNVTQGGQGGAGGTGGAGGDGNFGLGGAIATTATVQGTFVAPVTVIDHCDFEGNLAIGGNGSDGGTGGDGGFAGRGDGGGVIALLGSFSMSQSTLSGNSAIGGLGGRAGFGANTVGGDGGLARGGGFANERGDNAILSHVSILDNLAIGGNGGEGGEFERGRAGGAGGDALGGGVFNGRPAGTGPNPGLTAALTLDGSTVSGNLATGGTGGNGGNGGNALGGGINNSNPAPVAGTPKLTLFGTHIIGNDAVGGLAGAGGTAGIGQGGGLYNQLGAVANADALTVITGNHASTSDDDIFGSVTLI